MPSEACVEAGLFVTDLERSRHFYVDVLRMQLVEKIRLPGLSMLVLRHGPSTIKLIAPEEEPLRPDATGVVAGLRYLTLRVDDVVRVTGDCLAAGAELLRPIGPFQLPGESQPRAITSIVSDPDCVRLELCQGDPWAAQ